MNQAGNVVITKMCIPATEEVVGFQRSKIMETDTLIQNPSINIGTRPVLFTRKPIIKDPKASQTPNTINTLPTV